MAGFLSKVLKAGTSFGKKSIKKSVSSSKPKSVLGMLNSKRKRAIEPEEKLKPPTMMLGSRG